MRWLIALGVLVVVVCGAQEQGKRPPQTEKKSSPNRDETLRQAYKSLWEKVKASSVWVLMGGKRVAGGAVVDTGWVITSLTALGDARKFEVLDVDGNKASAHLVGVDLLYDVALLKVDGQLPAAKPIPFGSELLLRKGQFVFTVAPELQRFHVSVVSSLARNIARLPDKTLKRMRIMGILSDEFRGPHRSYVGVVQHDGRMPLEDRGLPLCDSTGKMVGLNIELIFRGVALAAPVTRIAGILPKLKKGYVLASYPYIGFRGRTLQEGDLPDGLRKELEELRKKAESPAGWGVVVMRVNTDSPADKGGLKKGDIIISIDYGPVWSLTDFRNRFKHMLPGMLVRLTIWRGNAKKELLIKVGERKPRILRLMLGKVDKGAVKDALEEAKRLLSAESVETLTDESGLTLLIKTVVPRSALKRHLRFAKTALKNAH